MAKSQWSRQWQQKKDAANERALAIPNDLTDDEVRDQMLGIEQAETIEPAKALQAIQRERSIRGMVRMVLSQVLA